MKKKLMAILAITVAVALPALYLWVPGVAPQGQQPLVKLTPTSLSQFTLSFDADANLSRVVLLFSPT